MPRNHHQSALPADYFRKGVSNATLCYRRRLQTLWANDARPAADGPALWPRPSGWAGPAEAISVTWTPVTFGKHAGLTLPQIMLTDPGWAFWAFERKIFYGRFAPEASDVYDKARRIRICKRRPERWLVDYRYDDTGRFLGFSFVRARNAPWLGSGHIRSEWLDLSRIRMNRPYDKGGGRNLLRDFRQYYFCDRNLTKRRCNDFFDDNNNFIVMPD
jgi:hypothetical protein